MIELPIDQIRAEFNTALTCVTHLLISAEPGAGKSTRLPLWALQHPALDELRIFLIQPRRLAAASVAEYLADQCGSRVGEIIGLRTRDEIKTSRCTRLEVMTPGMYLRVLQSDPELTGVAMVIFDEFHERSAQMDLGLALTLLSNDLFRGDDSVRVVVMSATLAIEPLVQYLPNIRLLACGGKTFPVSTEYKAKPARMTQEQHTAATIRATLTSYDGDLLVFLPGIRAIKWVADELGETTGIAVHMLHSSVPLKEQRAAIAPAAAGLRKVVLATNIAETSLTIEGIKVVIDSGLARQAVFDSSRGVTQLITGSISQAAAEQRKGRAGRVSEGHCIRLWDRQQHGRLRPFDLPELLTGDLAPTLLEATLFGEPHLGKLVLLDQPPAIAIERSWRELEQLGAVTRERRVTAHGERMAALGLAPALASMCVTAEGYGPEALKLACVLATVINEAVVLPAGADARAGLLVLASTRSSVCNAIGRRANRLFRRLSGPGEFTLAAIKFDSLSDILIAAFPDRVARLRSQAKNHTSTNERYLMARGEEVCLHAGDNLCGQPWLLVVDYQGSAERSQIKYALAITETEALKGAPHMLRSERRVFWDEKRAAVAASEDKYYGEILLSKQNVTVDDEERQSVLLEYVRREGLDCFGSAGFRSWQARLQWLREQGHEEVPNISDEVVLATLEDWLPPCLASVQTAQDLLAIPLLNILRGQVEWSLQQRIDELAPVSIALPTGQLRSIEYSRLPGPVLSARLQEVFGWTSSPTINGGRVALLIELLSPASRPVQLTHDLAGFWRNTYTEVRKELRGRYPRHFWPDDPASAQATHRARPRK